MVVLIMGAIAESITKEILKWKETIIHHLINHRKVWRLTIILDIPIINQEITTEITPMETEPVISQILLTILQTGTSIGTTIIIPVMETIRIAIIVLGLVTVDIIMVLLLQTILHVRYF
jgi:hypothetical protein